MAQTEFKQLVTFLYTHDLVQTAVFYEETLGLSLVLDQGSCRIYQVNRASYLGFCQHLDEAQAPQGVIITFVANDVDSWYQQLRQQGVVFEKPPTLNEKFNIYHCFLRDPNGYLLEIQRFLDPAWPQ